MNRHLSPTLLIAVLTLPLPAEPGGPTKDVPPPPGMVLVPGGRTKIGTPPEEIERLLEENENMRKVANSLVGETPQYTVDVPSFFMMVNEVTNEQYLAFVEATGHRVPQHWGEDAINAGRMAFLEEQGRKRKEALERGEEPPARVEFDAARWWAQNWDRSEWRIPQGQELVPVVYVDYSDAVAYCRWLGVRLPTEEEYQRACRGDRDCRFPWGDEWHDTKYCATNHLPRVKGVFPIGSFPDGNSSEGIVDLAGNVWEWTSSRFVPYRGYKMQKWTFGRGRNKQKISAMAAFDPNKRVVVGGSIQTSWLAARCTTRRGTERYQQTNSLGFRAAASLQVGRDITTYLVDEVPIETHPHDADGPVQYSVQNAIVRDRWRWKESEAVSKSMIRANATAVSGRKGVPPQYVIPTGYEHIAFVPVEQVQARRIADVVETSLKSGPVALGLLSLTAPTQEPALAQGVYYVAVRGKGKSAPPAEPAEGEEAAAAPPPVEEQLALDTTADNLVFFDLTGKPVAAMPLAVFEWGNVSPGKTAVVHKTITVMEGEEAVEIEQSWYEIRASIPGRGARKGIRFVVPLRFEDESYPEGDWRE